MTADPPRIEGGAGAAEPPGTGGGSFSPLPGEMGLPDVAAPQRQPVSKKGVVAVVVLVSSLVVASALAIQRFTAKTTTPHAADGKMVRDKPAAATSEPRRLDMGAAATAVSPGSSTPAPRIPALVPTEDELAEPIGVRRTGSSPSNPTGIKPLLPEDAPVLLVSTRPGHRGSREAINVSTAGGGSSGGVMAASARFALQPVLPREAEKVMIKR